MLVNPALPMPMQLNKQATAVQLRCLFYSCSRLSRNGSTALLLVLQETKLGKMDTQRVPAVFRFIAYTVFGHY